MDRKTAVSVINYYNSVKDIMQNDYYSVLGEMLHIVGLETFCEVCKLNSVEDVEDPAFRAVTAINALYQHADMLMQAHSQA